MNRVRLWRRLLAEFLGTALLVTTVVGSGIMATELSHHDVGLQLLQNSIATAFALGALILTFGPVSGAHFNPVVSAADWWLGRRHGTGLTGRDLAGYTVAQILGAIAGSVLANTMFALTVVTMSTKVRAGGHLWLGEVVATTGLLLLIFALIRSGRAAVAPAGVGAYIGAAYWFTSSTSFANPAVTVGRAFSGTFAGIAPPSVPAYVGAQLVGLVVGVGLIAALYPNAGAAADDDGVRHESTGQARNQPCTATGAVRTSWRMAAQATLHCLTGCAIGEVLGMVIGTALGWSDWSTVAMAVALAFVFGYALTMRGVLRAGIDFRTALKVALAADTISITVMEILDNTVMIVVPGAMEASLAGWVFWGSLAFAFAVAFVFTWPINRWLISRGKGHAVVHAYHH